MLANRTDVSSAVFLFFVAPAAPVLQGSFVLLSNNEGGGAAGRLSFSRLSSFAFRLIPN